MWRLYYSWGWPAPHARCLDLSTAAVWGQVILHAGGTMPTLGASSLSVLGLPHALWGVSSSLASPPSLDAKAPPNAHHLSWSLKNSCLEPVPKIIQAPTFPLGGILLPTSLGIEEDGTDVAPKCYLSPPHTIGPCDAICASGLEPQRAWMSLMK